MTIIIVCVPFLTLAARKLRIKFMIPLEQVFRIMVCLSGGLYLLKWFVNSDLRLYLYVSYIHTHIHTISFYVFLISWLKWPGN